jgi:hypothetical protein
MSKCVPQDWFLGYDQFAIYTWLNLNGQQNGEAGYLNTFIRPKNNKFNLFNNLNTITVGFANDFQANLKIGQQGLTFSSFFYYMG